MLNLTEYERDGYVGVYTKLPDGATLGFGIHAAKAGKSRTQAIVESQVWLKEFYSK